jgi:hypothetical protein
MEVGMSSAFALVLLALNSLAAAPGAQSSRSATLATQLTAALTERRLDAIAAQHPDEPDRFVAALFYPGAQLLVVSARYASPALLQARLSHRQYRDIYLDLQGAPIPNSSVFFQDMAADGLCSGREQTADLLYRGSAAPPKVFDGDWKKHSASEGEYEQQFIEADEQYSRLLEILVAQLGGT